MRSRITFIALTGLLISSLFFYAPATVLAATSGPNSGSTFANVDNAAGTAWASTSNAASSNDSHATVTFPASADPAVDFLVATGFGFAVPSGSTINGILVEIEVKVSRTLSFPSDQSVTLTKNGSSTVGSNLADYATYYTTTDTYISHGSASNLWGTTWTSTEINSANFGVFYEPYMYGSGATTGDVFSVDHFRITVTYTPPPSSAFFRLFSTVKVGERPISVTRSSRLIRAKGTQQLTFRSRVPNSRQTHSKDFLDFFDRTEGYQQ